MGDIVLTVEDLVSRRVTNLRLLGVRGPDQESLIGPFWENGHAFWISEAEEGRDLNGDGERADLVLHAHDAATGETTNTGLAVVEFPGNRSTPYVQQSGRWLELAVHELDQDRDLNGDGDMIDPVLHDRDRGDPEPAAGGGCRGPDRERLLLRMSAVSSPAGLRSGASARETDALLGCEGTVGCR